MTPKGAATHRISYDVPARGRDRQHVERLAAWLLPTVTRAIERVAGDVLDVGCGEQPLRCVIETAGGRYVGFDIEQNSESTVGVIGAIDEALPEPWPDSTSTYDVLVCTEVLEHVYDWPAAIENLRRLTKTGGFVIVTVPFAFPLHMEPVDYFRTTKFALPRLARDYGFDVVELVTLGDGRDVLLTLLEDLSILPAVPSVRARLSARAARGVRKLLIAALRRERPTLAMNSNFYLSNAAVLRAV